MSLICPECRGAAEEAAPTTKHAHGAQRFRHDDGTILCLVSRDGEMVPVLPIRSSR